VTKKLKAEVMLAILNLAPSKAARVEFERMAAQGDPEATWAYYRSAIAARKDKELSIARAQRTTFEMLLPAVETIYNTPTSTSVTSRGAVGPPEVAGG
jgi:hypothetical protein